jgi:hypothetical protein
MFKILSSHNIKTFSKGFVKSKIQLFNLNSNFLHTKKNFSENLKKSFNDVDPNKKTVDFYDNNFKINSPPENISSVSKNTFTILYFIFISFQKIKFYFSF